MRHGKIRLIVSMGQCFPVKLVAAIFVLNMTPQCLKHHLAVGTKLLL